MVDGPATKLAEPLDELAEFAHGLTSRELMKCLRDPPLRGDEDLDLPAAVATLLAGEGSEQLVLDLSVMMIGGDPVADQAWTDAMASALHVRCLQVARWDEYEQGRGRDAAREPGPDDWRPQTTLTQATVEKLAKLAAARWAKRREDEQHALRSLPAYLVARRGLLAGRDTPLSVRQHRPPGRLVEPLHQPVALGISTLAVNRRQLKAAAYLCHDLGDEARPPVQIQGPHAPLGAQGLVESA